MTEGHQILGSEAQRAILIRYLTPQKIGEKGQSQGVIQHSEPHERRPFAPKFEHRSQERALDRGRCARRDALEVAQHVLKFEEKDKATFYSPSEVWLLPAPSSTEHEERKFAVDSGALMHMLIGEDLSSAELDTIQRSTNPTTVVTASGRSANT